jgi:hypothetical protein
MRLARQSCCEAMECYTFLYKGGFYGFEMWKDGFAELTYFHVYDIRVVLKYRYRASSMYLRCKFM